MEKCLICITEFKNKKSLGAHIGYYHNTKNYYDTYLKTNKLDGLCKICNKQTDFINLQKGYKQTCSKECCDKLDSIIINSLDHATMLKKRKETCQKIYGVENTYQNNYIKEKSKQTCLKNFGVKNISQSEYAKRKKEETCLKNFGVRHAMQNTNVFIERFKKRVLLKYFKNTNIYYRGSYELDFLEKYYSKYSDIQNAPSIKYKFNDKLCVYFPDFYIPSLNLIIEIKNSYLAKRDKDKIRVKKCAVIATGFKYIMIVNKNYNEFIF
jgi:superfamily II DNA helicase RecQ